MQLSALPAAGRFDYEVIRKGEKIGTHSVVFRHEGRRLAVATWTDIAVELLGVALYRFHYEAEEDWIDGKLTRLISRTDNDGEMLNVNLTKAGGRIRGTCNGVVLDLPGDIFPISVWHPEFIRQSVIFDQYQCAQRKITTTDRGSDLIARLEDLTARHYAVGGDLERDVWYDADGQTVQVLFPAKDGSEITFVMRPFSRPALTMEQGPSSSLVRNTP